MSDELLKWRSEFPTLENSAYLISHSLGAIPRNTLDSVKTFFDEWRDKSISAWYGWLDKVDEFAGVIGDIINAPKGTVITHQNVSTLVSIIISSLRPTANRNRVVYTEMNFPTVHYNFLGHKPVGFNPVLVKSRDGIIISTEDFIKEIDERTLAVVIDYAIYKSGYIQDAKRITEAAHKFGAYSIVDAYQAVGTVPVDVQDIDCDFLVGGSVKWLCGGPGAAYMYIRKDKIKNFEPMNNGWFSQKKPFDFDMSRLDFRDDSWRFIGGTPSVISLYQAISGPTIVRDIGVRNIRDKSVKMTQYLIDQAKKLPVKINSPLDSKIRGGIVCIDFEGSDKLTNQLVATKIFVDHRPNCGIRISPHFYTTVEELDRILLEIKKAVT